MFELLGLMTNEPIIFHIHSYIDDSTMTYEIEVDEATYDYNWYFLTSGAAYSAGNVTPMIATENDIAITIGAKTGGGGTAIEFVVSSLLIQATTHFFMVKETS